MNTIHHGNDVLYLNMRMRELHATAAEARLARQLRGPRPIRRRMGRILISAGEALSGQPQALAVADHRWTG